MAQIRFYRGASGVTLPSYQDGAVFIVANDAQKDGIPLGDMYVDVPGEDNTGQRLHIIPSDAIYYKTASDWTNSEEWGDISVANKIYVLIADSKPSMAVGDGTTAVGNLIFSPLFYVASNTAPSSVTTSASAGISENYARADHVHNITTATITGLLGSAAVKDVDTSVNSTSENLPTSKAVDAAIDAAVSAAVATIPSASTSDPLVDGTKTPGTSNTWARADHVHPTDTSRAPVAHAATSTTYGAGTGTNYGHVKLSDATNSNSAATNGGTAATPKAVADALTEAKNYTTSAVASATTSISANIPAAGNTTPKAVATVAAVGTAAAFAREDHIHNITSATIISALTYTPANANDLPSGSMVFKGVTTAAINDGSTTKPTDIYTGSAAPKAGDVVAYNSKEFVWGGSPAHWIEFGDFSDLQNTLGNFAYANTATGGYTPSGTLTITLPTASKNVVSSVSTGTVVTAVTTAAQTMVTGVTTAAQTIATGGTSTNITITGEKLVIPSAVLTGVTTTSINKVTAVSTASKNIVSSVSTGTAVTAVTTAAQTMVTGQPTTKTFTGTTATITIEPVGMPV